MSSNPDTFCEVIQTADGYSIRRTDAQYYVEWWHKGRYGDYWSDKSDRHNFEFKWCAIMKAKALERGFIQRRRAEEKASAERERRQAFVERKVWR
jgi:hypothetical protein